MAGELESLRNNLESTVEGFWNDDAAQEFRNELDDVLDTDVSEAFRECLVESNNNPRECLRETAAEEGVADEFDSAWDGAPDDLVSDLRTINNLWSQDQREMVREIALNANLSELNRLCANGEYGEVADELGLDGQPNSYQDCVTATSEAGDIRENLKALWGTGS